LVSFQATTFEVSEINALVGNNKALLPSKAALLFQDSDDQLFCPTVEEDIAFGPLNQGLDKIEVKQRVDATLENVGMTDKRNKPPHQLSGGEKRRVALAGLLAMNPDILLLDEPTQFLDHRSRRSLISILNENKHTKLVATHDFEMALETCTRVILLDHGKIMADGPIRKILSDESLLKLHGMEAPHSLKPTV
jgi:cobalt/nickel transport system ATP-binding protein